MNSAIGAGRDTDPVPGCHRDRTKMLLAAALEHHLSGHGQPACQVGDGPWDVWWACYRAQRTATGFGLDPRRAPGRCEVCAGNAGNLAHRTPPAHPDDDHTARRRCSCLLDWATSMRRPAPALDWPEWRLTVGMVKPGADAVAVRGYLMETYAVLDTFERRLTPADVRRLYPDAYGAEYVARQDDYLTSSPVTVFVLLTKPAAVGKAKDIKADVRRRLGDTDVLRNHLHMPDSPGDAFADLDHLVGGDLFTRLYERHERDRAAYRVARYRALLDRPDPRARAG